jgi:dynein heavy chain
MRPFDDSRGLYGVPPHTRTHLSCPRSKLITNYNVKKKREKVCRIQSVYCRYLVSVGSTVYYLLTCDSVVSACTGVYVHGLYLDGAGWDKRNCKLIEPAAKVLYPIMPVVHVYAVNTATGNVDKRRSVNVYECPVYKKPRRTDLTYIFPLMLRTSRDPDHWIMRGVALLCDTK